MTLDISQIAVIFASGAVTLTVTMIGWQMRKHTLKQEASAKRREQKQELHYKKIDAVIYALASASENINGAMFKKNYDEKMKEFLDEADMMGAFG